MSTKTVTKQKMPWREGEQEKYGKRSKTKDERRKKISLSCRTFSVIKSEPKTQG